HGIVVLEKAGRGRGMRVCPCGEIYLTRRAERGQIRLIGIIQNGGAVRDECLTGRNRPTLNFTALDNYDIAYSIWTEYLKAVRREARHSNRRSLCKDFGFARSEKDNVTIRR